MEILSREEVARALVEIRIFQTQDVRDLVINKENIVTIITILLGDRTDEN